MDLTSTIIPKSNQLNFDDFLATGEITIKITDVRGGEEPQQPVSIHYDGDNGKPYKPCKSMRRVLVQVWGSDGKKYIGRSLTLYGDEKVIFGGAAVGGIRIKAMSDIDKPITMALTASKASRKPFTVQPLVVAEKKAPAPKAKEDLTPDHPKWQGAMDAMKSGKTDIDKIKAAYNLNAECEQMLVDG